MKRWPEKCATGGKDYRELTSCELPAERYQLVGCQPDDPMMKPTGIFFVAALIVAACVQPPVSSPDGDSTTPPASAQPGSQDADWAAILRLEDQAKVIAKVGGCATVSQCRTAPVGNRACGGPRYYLAYCATSTDSMSLFRKLEEIASAENAYNRKYQLASTCEFRMPPPLALSGGECRAAGQ